jgi:hypothetical protein
VAAFEAGAGGVRYRLWAMPGTNGLAARLARLEERLVPPPAVADGANARPLARLSRLGERLRAAGTARPGPSAAPVEGGARRARPRGWTSD